ncbi:MAG: DUF1343 domain-containing protein [Lachnospiraceae bacterium]|nr:DUF1343 domain-containing protein [Lachnospiraceae bacterium]
MLSGIDTVRENDPRFKGGRIALLTNPSGRNKDGKPDIDILNDMFGLSCLFAPEHGIRGNGNAGEEMSSFTDPVTNLMVYSLYGSHRELTEEMLDSFDILVYDIQDVGVRFYTYISTMRGVMRACAKAGKKMIVLDRPNPLGGTALEGGVLNKDFLSFVGCYDIPVRYAMTPGEIALMMNAESECPCELEVVPLEGWNRNDTFHEYGKVWFPPSVSLMNYENTLLYPGTCLFEGTNLSEGRGTAAPFRIIGAPFVDGDKLTDEFMKLKLPGVYSTPVWFNPSASKHSSKACGGILLHVTDYHEVRPYETGLRLLYLIKEMYPNDFEFLSEDREGGHKWISLLSGDDRILDGELGVEELLNQYCEEHRIFNKRKESYRLY